MLHLPTGRRFRLYISFLLGCFFSLAAHAQYDGLDPYEDFGKRLNASQQVAPLTSAYFGDSVSLYSGATSFVVTDVSVPGNALPVEIGRSLAVVDRRLDPGSWLGGFGDWDLDLPYVTGTFLAQHGWQLDSNSNYSYARCSDTVHVPNTEASVPGGSSVPYQQVWDGNRLHVPGGGDQELLVNNQSAAPAYGKRQTYPWVTTGNYVFSCIASTANGLPGEGFVATSPAGIRYTFNWAVTRQTTPIAFQYDPTLKPAKVPRSNVYLLPTRVEDRFGNWVDYTYSGDHLTQIVASDGRAINLTWSGETITQVTSAAGTWRYTYVTDSVGMVHLSSVTLPDQSRWVYTIAAGSLITVKHAWPDDSVTSSQHCQIDPEPNTGSFTYVVDAPSGARATYQFDYTRHLRNYVPYSCHDFQPLHNYPEAFDFFDNFALQSKEITGAGLTTQTWTYTWFGFSAATDGYYTASSTYSPGQPYEPTGDCSSCQPSISVAVRGPDQTTRYTFGVQYARNEGQLLATEIEGLDGSIYQSTSNTFMSDVQAQSAPFANIAGTSLLPNYVNPMGNRQRPVVRTDIVQSGDTFTHLTEAFNAFVQPTQIKRFSSIAGQPSSEEAFTYLNDLSHWMLGVETQVDNLTTGETVRKDVYDLADVTLAQRYRFGQLQKSYAFAADGTLSSFTDGNGHTTQLGAYKRGLPQSISYPDGTSQHLVIDDAGQISSLTDQAGNTTSYAYDGVGRVTQITYPTGDSVAWAPKVFTYAYVTAAERGIGANHWRRTVSHGNAQSVTYFDAELRPILSDSYISTDGTSHTTARTDYDWRGQKTFVSYPQAGALNLTDLTTGTTTQYDALGRAIQTLQSSELGTLTSSTAYLSGARMQVTDPKSKVTTTTYQVFDQPSYDAVTLVQAPDGINQAIARDVYGNPTAIRQYGSYNGLTKDLTKYLYYDSYHRLCRTAEPESGSTVMAYDAANNVAWTADGLSISGTDCGQTSVADAAKTTRTYDAMNRVLTLVPPAGTQSTQYTYDALGNVKTAVSGVSTWSASRNALGLVTGEGLQVTGQSAWGLGYGYDANGSLSSITYPDGTAVAYAPDALGRPTQAGGYATGVTYFSNGEVSAFTFGNGALYVAQQNSRQLLRNFSYAKGTTLNVSEDYVYDANANITNVNDLAGGPRTKSFTYDDLNRLTSATATNLWGTESYSYDSLNNIASRTGGSTTVTYSYNGLNQLAGLSDGTSFAYDPRGNAISKNGVALAFDAKNQLQNVGGSVAYAYDASGRRVSKTPTSGGATYYFYSQAGQLMYQWEPGSAKATDYVYLGKRMLARNETYNTQVTGNIDGVTVDGSGNATINGWACSTHLNQSIGVEVFAGGASGAGGVRITTATASVASEPAVASACQASGSNYRFKVPLTDAMRSQYGGQVLYMYGDSPVGVGNLVLARSGSFTMPVARVGGAPTITSPTTGSSNTTGAYTVAWSAVSGATSYTLQEQVNGGSWSTVQASDATSLAVSSKGNGTYGYQVQACNSSGCSAWSTVVSTTVLLQPPAPGTITVPATSSGSIGVSWAASGTATSYTLQQSLNGGAWSNAYSGSGTGATVSEGATGSYTFQVQACNASGCSGWKGSAAVAVTIPPASAPPISAPSSNNTGSYTVSWTGVSGATSYTLQEQVNGGGWTTVQSSGGGAWGATGHGNGTYGYHVQACNAGGCGPWSGTVNVVVLLPPPAPGSITVPATSSGNIGVSWAASSTATSYTLQQSLNGGGWSTVYSGGATSATLGVGTTGSYTYQVQACNGGGCSGWTGSSAVSVTIPPASAPTLTLPGSSTTGSYTVSWTGVSGATSYTLQEQVNGGGWTTIQSNSATSIGISGKGNGTYGYQVQACNIGGCSGWSAVGATSVLFAPATPSDLVSTLYVITDPNIRPPRRYQLEASWSAVPWASSYDLYNCQSSGACGTRTLTTNSAPPQLVGGTTTSVKVRACNATGCSAWSATVVPTTVNQ